MTLPPVMTLPETLTGESAVLRLTFDGPLAVLTLDSPPMNLFDKAMWAAWADAVAWLTAHPRVPCSCGRRAASSVPVSM